MRAHQELIVFLFTRDNDWKSDLKKIILRLAKQNSKWNAHLFVLQFNIALEFIEKCTRMSLPEKKNVSIFLRF